MSWKVTVRIGPKVEKVRAGSLDEALDAVELHARAAANTVGRDAFVMRVRRYEAGDQVAARVELHGPGVAAGVDVRGDGATEAWTGRVRRHVVEQEERETPYDALRRVLAQRVSVDP